MNGPKILLVDIETAPIDAYVWGLWKQNIGIKMIAEDWHILCWCAKWVGQDEVLTCALPDFPGYKKNPRDDYYVLAHLWDLMDEADIIVAHNGDGFDIPKINTRMLIQGFGPYAPIRPVDTLKMAKRVFSFTSNKLDFIAQALDIGKKIDTGGFELWDGCLAGDAESWNNMVDYCAHDVQLLEGVYTTLRPWDQRHPNLALYIDDRNGEIVCPACASTNVKRDGVRTHKTNMSTFQLYRCKDCGAQRRGRKNIADRNGLLVGAI